MTPAKKMTAHEALMEWRNVARQEHYRHEVERDRAEDLLLDKNYAEEMVETLRADLERAQAELRWYEQDWWRRLLWWRR